MSSSPHATEDACLPQPADRPVRRGWQSAEVVEIVDEAPDTVTLRLALEVASGFLPGQYYNVRLLVPGRPRPVQRAYSIGSSPMPDDSMIEIGIREVPGGLVSPRDLVREFPVGTRVEVRGPTGRFTWTEQDGGPVLLVGAGSGLVPLVSIVRYAATSKAVPMALLCSAASFDYALYRDDLTLLAAANDWLRVVHVFTRDLLDRRALYHRRIDSAMIAEVLDGALPEHAYLCGPPAMVENVASWLLGLGLDVHRIHTEKYD